MCSETTNLNWFVLLDFSSIDRSQWPKKNTSGMVVIPWLFFSPKWYCTSLKLTIRPPKKWCSRGPPIFRCKNFTSLRSRWCHRGLVGGVDQRPVGRYEKWWQGGGRSVVGIALFGQERRSWSDTSHFRRRGGVVLAPERDAWSIKNSHDTRVMYVFFFWGSIPVMYRIRCNYNYYRL